MAVPPDSPATPDLVRKLATILSADVAEFSRLMAEDEEQTLRTFRAHAQVFESLVGMHRGRIFNTAGDAILAEFSSAVEAVRCATEIQAALHTRNEQFPEASRVRFRIGVNLGDVMVQGSDLLGDGVNVAARLQTAAQPGGICLSGSVYDQIRNKLSLSFTSLGEKTFKNIPQPVRTFSISAAEGLGALPSPRRARHGAGVAITVGALVAVVLAVAVGAGYWLHGRTQHTRTEQARAVAEAERKKAAEAAAAAAVVATPPASPTPVRSVPPAPSVAAAPPATATPPVAATPSAPAAVAGVDGQYTGQLCFGAGIKETARCGRALGTVDKGHIDGKWTGRDGNVTTILSGTVSPAGEVKAEVRTETVSGSRQMAVDLAGTLKNGLLETTGSMRNGRSATLNMHKN
jgi:class 3 adenylate cyclase